MLKYPLEKEVDEKITKSISVCAEELATLHSGRATPALVENVKITYYSTPTPLKQISVITVPQQNLLSIRPYEPNLVGEIQKALLKANLGLNISADAKTVRVMVPAPSEERRKQLVQRAREIAENAKVAVRNIRKDIKKRIETLKKDGEIPEDDAFRLIDRIQDMVKKAEEKIDELFKKKEEEILNI
jgi:ribosome recycling factor